MADTAVHLEQAVLPRVPIRHWICSLPWGLRSLLGYDRKLCSEVVSAFMTEVDRSLRWRAKRELGLASVGEAFTGSVLARAEDGQRAPTQRARPDRARTLGLVDFGSSIFLCARRQIDGDH